MSTTFWKAEDQTWPEAEEVTEVRQHVRRRRRRRHRHPYVTKDHFCGAQLNAFQGVNECCLSLTT